MLTFKSWAVSVVTAAAVVCVISFFTPSGAMGKTLKTIIGLFLMASFILPFSDTDIASGLLESTKGIKEIIDENKYENQMRKSVSDSLENAIEAEICAYLSNAEVDYIKVEAEVYVDSKNNIDTKSILIVLREDIQINEIVSFISERFGAEPDVIVESED